MQLINLALSDVYYALQHFDNNYCRSLQFPTRNLFPTRNRGSLQILLSERKMYKTRVALEASFTIAMLYKLKSSYPYVNTRLLRLPQ